ncbi:MAG: methyltransferase domain-containing protein [bacterium]
MQAPAPATVAGFVDSLNSERLSGWAWDSTRPTEAIAVDVYVDNTLVHSVLAGDLGADLLGSGIGDGYHRWSVDVADLIVDEYPHQLAVRFHDTSVDLTNSPKRYLRGILDMVSGLEPQALAAALYLRGEGIEIGALNKPMPVPAGATTRYVDRMSDDDLRREYPEMAGYDLVPVSIVADGENLDGMEDGSQDYVVANNFLEHCQDPIATIKNFFRVLRPDGVVFLVVPNKRSNIDIRRDPTTIEHLIADHERRPGASKLEHFREWTRLVLNVDDDDEVVRHADQLIAEDYSIHFHVFTEFETLELFGILHRRYRVPFVLEYVANNRCHETVIVARKEAAQPSSAKQPEQIGLG